MHGLPPSSEADLAALQQQVLAAAFLLGVVFGAVAQRSQFCTMGALSDFVLFGSTARLRQWLIAIGVAMIGFGAMAGAGWIDAADSLYAGRRLNWASHALGGALFGFGMVLASGCGSKMLVRLGGGSLKALVVFCVLGLAAYATLRGVVGVLRVATVDVLAIELPAGQDLPSLLAWAGLAPRRALAAALGLGIGAVLLIVGMARPEGRSAEVLIGGLGIGAVVVAAWWVSGRWGQVAEHPQTLERAFVGTASGRMESLSFVAPIAHTIDWLILFSDTSRRLTLGVVAVAGVVAGSAAAALTGRSFRWEGFAGTEDTANHIVGAALMGIGGVMALGCTVGQGLSGVSTLSLGSAIAVAGIVAGGVAALRWQAWRLERVG